MTKANGEISTALYVTSGRHAIFRKNGGRLYLCPWDDESFPGGFILRCPIDENCNSFVEFRGDNTGNLRWKNNPLIGLSASYRSGVNWYRKYSDGWIEQGGVITASSYNDSGTFTFNQPFKDSNYTITSGQARGSEAGQGTLSFYALDAASFSYKVSAGQSYYNDKYHWFACGY